jgi:hypothetical protein
MWVCISDAFLSIVHKDCNPDELLVRARREGDIQKLIPGATVAKTIGNDYLFRAVVKRTVVAEALTKLAMETITYDNFKNTVRDNRLHSAYNRIWHVMADLQVIAPYTNPRRVKAQRGLPL